jgi:glycosyltransferase involved in cell wall biosynthesis
VPDSTEEHPTNEDTDRRASRTSEATGEARRGSVAFLIPSLDAGGAERQLIGLAAGLHRDGWRVRVLTFYDGGALANDLTGRGVVVESLRKGGRRDLPGFLVRLARSIRRDRPDVLHAYLLGPNIAAVIVKLLVPGLRVVWGVRASDMKLALYGGLSSTIFGISCRLSRFADLIICNSTAGLEFHAGRGYPRTRMVAIPNGIDGEVFAPDRAARQAIRSEWSVTDDHVLVGLAGRLDRMKDHPTFLHAARLVATDRPDVRFACVGDGPSATRLALQRLAADLGIGDRVIWIAGRPDMAAVYNAFDLAVSSSLGEGFPNVVAEAMATGVPCVVTNVGDSAFLVGDSGWVCPPGSPPQLAAAITSAVSSRQELARRGVRARQRVTTEFTEDRRDRATSDQLMKLVRGS